MTSYISVNIFLYVYFEITQINGNNSSNMHHDVLNNVIQSCNEYDDMSDLVLQSRKDDTLPSLPPHSPYVFFHHPLFPPFNSETWMSHDHVGNPIFCFTLFLNNMRYQDLVNSVVYTGA